MRLPKWLDVALEGGVLELERALREYRAIRRGLSGDWRARALELAEVTASALSLSGGKSEGLPLRLAWLHELTSEESYYARSRLRFRRERAGLTVALLGLAVAIPWSTWAVASMGGQLPTMLSIDGLEEPSVWGLLLVLLGGVAVGWARLLDWGWLGVRAPRLVGPGSLGAAAGLSGVAAVASFAARNPLPVFVVLAGSAGLGAVFVLGALWRDSFARGNEVGEIRSTPLPDPLPLGGEGGRNFARGRDLGCEPGSPSPDLLSPRRTSSRVRGLRTARSRERSD